jgi:hypothetical protein
MTENKPCIHKLTESSGPATEKAKPFICLICGITSESEDTLNSHKLREHDFKDLSSTSKRMRVDIELHLDGSGSEQWFVKITELLAHATDLGFKDIKIKPEGYSIMKYGIEYPPAGQATDAERQKALTEWELYKNSKINKK